MPKILIATDHAGFELKEKLVIFLESLGYEVKDFGAYSYNINDDYPDFIIPLAKKISENPELKGIVIGGSGQGEAIVANRFKRVRCGVYYGGDTRIINFSREHNNSNILSLGARFLSEEQAKDAIKIWLDTQFSNEIRHISRNEKIDNI